MLFRLQHRKFGSAGHMYVHRRLFVARIDGNQEKRENKGPKLTLDQSPYLRAETDRLHDVIGRLGTGML